MDTRMRTVLETLLRRARERRDLVAVMLLEQRIAREADGALVALVSR